MAVGGGVDKGELGAKHNAHLEFWLRCLENGGGDLRNENVVEIGLMESVGSVGHRRGDTRWEAGQRLAFKGTCFAVKP